MKRDWKTNPPQTLSEARDFAMEMAQSACDHAYKMTGERPVPVEVGYSIYIQWPDGERTNEIRYNHKNTHN